MAFLVSGMSWKSAIKSQPSATQPKLLHLSKQSKDNSLVLILPIYAAPILDHSQFFCQKQNVEDDSRVWISPYIYAAPKMDHP